MILHIVLGEDHPSSTCYQKIYTLLGGHIDTLYCSHLIEVDRCCYYTCMMCRSDFTMQFNGEDNLSIIIISSPDRCCLISILTPDWLMDV